MPPRKSIPLWTEGAVPGALGNNPDRDAPALAPFWPEPAESTGAACIVCPGGGYGGLAAHEGGDYAVWLNGRGIAAFVLDYRLGSNGYRHPAMLLDIMRAIRMVRSHAAEWQIDPARVGVMGSSAGGHLASTALTHFDDGQPAAGDPVERAGSRPDFGVLCYPVISMGGVTHGGSRQNLLGDNPPADLVELLSSDLQVTRDTPPCFIWHTADDAVVDVRNSLDFAAALSKNGVPFELHVYPHGAHGLGLGVHGYDPAGAEAPELLRWTRELAVWLRESGIGR